MTEQLGLSQLKKMWPTAWVACQNLPGCVVDIWVDDGTLYCMYGPGDDKEAYWDLAERAWCDPDTNEPILKDEKP